MSEICREKYARSGLLGIDKSKAVFYIKTKL